MKIDNGQGQVQRCRVSWSRASSIQYLKANSGNAHIRSHHGRTNYLASSLQIIKKNAGEGDESFAVTFLLDLACGGRAVHFFSSSSFFTLSHDQTRE